MLESCFCGRTGGPRTRPPRRRGQTVAAMSRLLSSGPPDVAPRTRQAARIRGGRSGMDDERSFDGGLKNHGKPTTDKGVSNR